MQDLHIYLASSSPRRRTLLEQIGIRYRTLAVDVDEGVRLHETPEMYALRLALEKARAGWRSLAPRSRYPVLGADTAVVLDGEVLGKPYDCEHALAMLARLSGRGHQVLTAAPAMEATRKRAMAGNPRIASVS